jgi:hypothetical protein
MKKLMNVFFGIVTVVSLAIANSRVAVADTISGIVTVNNPGFEDPSAGKISGGWDASTDIPGWSNGTVSGVTYTSQNGHYSDTGVEATSSHSGSYRAYLYNYDPDGGSCIQTTTHAIATASDTYTLTFYSEYTNNLALDSTLRATLYYIDDSGTRVTLGTALETLTHNSWVQYTLSVTATDASVGHYVGIYFSNVSPNPSIAADRDWLALDDVTLTYTTPAPVPEPSAMILLSTGIIGLLAYAWRKRRNGN